MAHGPLVSIFRSRLLNSGSIQIDACSIINIYIVDFLKSIFEGTSAKLMCIRSSAPPATSFRRMLYVYHHALKHNHTNIIVSFLSS